MTRASNFRAALAATIVVSVGLSCVSPSPAASSRECVSNPQTKPASLLRPFLVADVERTDLRHGYDLLWPGSSVRTISCQAFLTGTNEVQPFLAIDWRYLHVSLVDRRPRSRLFAVQLVSHRRAWPPAVFLLELTQRGRYWRVNYWAAAPGFAVPA